MHLETSWGKYSCKIRGYNLYFHCNYNPAAKEVILFLHGLACSLDSFRNVNDYSYFSDKSLLMIDILGFGKSSKPEDFSYTMEDQAEIIEELLSILPAWNIHIAAHSMAGAIALLFKPSTYSRIKSFVNIEGNLISEDCGMLSRGIISVPFIDYAAVMYKEHVSEFKGHQQLRFYETNPLAVYNSAKSLVKWSESGELLNRFKFIECRKSYFYGEENKNMEVLKSLGFVPKYMISNSGHGMMTENPKEFYSKLAEFINMNGNSYSNQKE